MAVSPMKLVTVVGPVEQFDKVVDHCIINREFHPESTMTVMKKVKGLYPFELNNPFADALRQAEHIADKTGWGLAYHSFEDQELHVDEVEAWFNGFERQYGDLIEEKDTLMRRNAESSQILLQLDHVRDVSVPLQEFFDFTYVKFRFGKMPREIYDSFYPHVKDRKDVYFFNTSIERDTVYGMYMTPRVYAERIDSLFASLQFERIRLSDRLEGTGDEAMALISEDIRVSTARIEEIGTLLEQLLAEKRERFYTYYSYVRYRNDAFDLRAYAGHTEESFYLLGWVPDTYYEDFSKQLESFGDLSIVVLGENPEMLTDYTPPIKLKNRKIFRVFEPFVAMYGLPSYNEIDPTPLMTITYSLLFGVMFGDIGQGALLILVGYLMWRLKKMWLGRVICYAGAASMLFGAVYGSIFGFEDILPGFKVLHPPSNSKEILTLSVYGGAILVTIAIAFNIFNGIRQRKADKVLFGSNALAGGLLYWGVVMLVLPFIGFGEAVLKPGVLLICMLLPVAMVFLREPLSKLIERQKDWKPHESAGNFFVSNFFEMFEILLSFMTNTLSFLRVGAYAISHASMMTVVFSLAKTADGGHNIVVIILGNLLVAGIEGLLVGIQVLRLEFYELFGRFYSGEGRPYEPMKIDYKTKKE